MPSIPESQVQGLVTDLAGKGGVPLAHVFVNFLVPPAAGVATTAQIPNGSAPLNASRYNTGGALNDNVDYDMHLDAGTWSMEFYTVKSTNTAIVTVQFADIATNGTVGSFTTAGTMDTYAVSATGAVLELAGIVVATAGRKRLRMLAATKNASSTGYFMNLAGASFVRTA